MRSICVSFVSEISVQHTDKDVELCTQEKYNTAILHKAIARMPIHDSGIHIELIRCARYTLYYIRLQFNSCQKIICRPFFLRFFFVLFSYRQMSGKTEFALKCLMVYKFNFVFLFLCSFADAAYSFGWSAYLKLFSQFLLAQ